MRRHIYKLLGCESGATAAEYVLILAIVGASIAVAALALGNSIGGTIGDTSTCITTGGGAC